MYMRRAPTRIVTVADGTTPAIKGGTTVTVDTVCSNSYSGCKDWVSCCPGGKGSIKGQVTCSTADCPDPGKPCTGGWMKNNCKQTCGLCTGVIPGGRVTARVRVRVRVELVMGLARGSCSSTLCTCAAH